MQPITEEPIQEIKNRLKDITKSWFVIFVEKIWAKVQGKVYESNDEKIKALVKNFPEDFERDYIQKYAETEINDFNTKLGKNSYIMALIALIISATALLNMPQINSGSIPIFGFDIPKDLFLIIYICFLIFLIVWLFSSIFEKNLLKIIIMRIEEKKFNEWKENNQNENKNPIISETETTEKDLKIKVEKFNLNLSISGER